MLCDECEQPRLEPLGSKEEECQPATIIGLLSFGVSQALAIACCYLLFFWVFFLNIETDGWHSAALFPNDMELLGLNYSPANSQYISNCIEETSFNHVTSVIIT